MTDSVAKQSGQPWSQWYGRLLLPLVSLALLSYLPEVFKYQGFIQRHTGIPLLPSLILVLGVLLIGRVVWRPPVSVKVSRLYLMFVVPALTAATVAMHLIEQATYPNFIFNYSRINPAVLAIWTVLVALYGLCFLSKAFLHRYGKQFIFLYGVVSFWFFAFIRWWYTELFLRLEVEDGLIEYLTFFFFLVASWFCVRAFFNLRHLKLPIRLKQFWLLLLAVSALGLFLVAGEEISWGQRLLSIQSSDYFMSRNLQNETNLHNLDSVFGKVYDAYLVLGLYGIFSGLLRRFNQSHPLRRYTAYFEPVLSRLYLSPYFVYIVGYVIWRYTAKNEAYDIWEETTELFLAIGVCLLFWFSYQDIRHLSRKKLS